MGWELLSKLPAVSYPIESLKTVGHSLWPSRLVAVSNVAIPSAEPPDHPSEASKTTFRIVILLLGGPAFELFDKRLHQGLVVWIERIGELLTSGAISRHHELHDANRGDQCCSRKLDHGVGIKDLALFDIKALSFQGAEYLLNDPAPAIEGDDAFGIRQALDCVRQTYDGSRE